MRLGSRGRIRMGRFDGGGDNGYMSFILECFFSGFVRTASSLGFLFEASCSKFSRE